MRLSANGRRTMIDDPGRLEQNRTWLLYLATWNLYLNAIILFRLCWLCCYDGAMSCFSLVDLRRHLPLITPHCFFGRCHAKAKLVSILRYGLLFTF
ncbi:hypothetical protein M405DRAFT_273712 [Rhizopogon salebrosus TDB-379]|nr:hypothetical protein M405DRAFT_273712 [Rhizopogon salebrosus TDB-379]